MKAVAVPGDGIVIVVSVFVVAVVGYVLKAIVVSVTGYFGR